MSPTNKKWFLLNKEISSNFHLYICFEREPLTRAFVWFYLDKSGWIIFHIMRKFFWTNVPLIIPLQIPFLLHPYNKYKKLQVSRFAKKKHNQKKLFCKLFIIESFFSPKFRARTWNLLRKWGKKARITSSSQWNVMKLILEQYKRYVLI